MNKSEPDIYVYKMVADNGGAPCVFRNLLSLAICKPKIRKSAKKGALIFGFGGKDYQERLIYIAHVTSKLGGQPTISVGDMLADLTASTGSRGALLCARTLRAITSSQTRERKMWVRILRMHSFCLAMTSAIWERWVLAITKINTGRFKS
jgi:hypothetical protein